MSRDVEGEASSCVIMLQASHMQLSRQVSRVRFNYSKRRGSRQGVFPTDHSLISEISLMESPHVATEGGLAGER